uniref:hydroxyisourate hydrolase n=1 Tax=Homalodisca liturata TaxID=320908 RepID=A0A1B6K2F4_9HEMI
MPKESKFKQSYRSTWESLPDFKGWLQPVPDNPSRAFCTICDKTLYAHRLSLLQHTCTVKHTRLAQRKFIESEKQKSDLIQTEVLAMDVVPGGGVDLNTFVQPDIDSSEDEAPNVYISTVSQPLPNSSDSPSIVEINNSPPISTHVLDTCRGLPVQNLQVSLYKLLDGRWTHISDCVTNPVGRCNEFISREDFKVGRYKLHYDVDRYFELRRQDSMYPFIEIVFDARSPTDHLHIPLIMSPYGYSTYRGS